MADIITWDRIAQMNVEAKGGTIALMEYRQVGDKGLISGFDHEKGKQFFAHVDAIPESVGRRSKDIAEFMKRSADTVLSTMKEVAHFDDMPLNIFDREAHKLGTARIEKEVLHTGPSEHGTTLHINKETGNVSSMIHKGSNKLGMVAGIIGASYFALRGEFAQAAEVAIPGATSAIALSQGRPAEAVMAGVEMVPLGLALTEITRPMARNMGFDVDPGLLNVTRLQPTAFDRFYDAIPDRPRPGMPPEMEGLVEMKGMIRQAEAKLKDVNDHMGNIDDDLAANRMKAEKGLDRAQQLFGTEFDTLKANGGLQIAQAYMAHQDRQPATTLADAGPESRPAVTARVNNPGPSASM